MYKVIIIKRIIENIFIFPFIVIGRLYSKMYPLENQYRIFFFFPFYHVGGAEKVHAQIAQATGNNNCIIYFTRRSHNDLFLPEFKKSGCEIKDISKYTDNKWLYFLNLIYRGIITGYINRQKSKPVVFNGQCNFGYKISPWVKREIPQIELIHALNTFSHIRIPFLEFYKKSITVSQEIIDKHKNLYTNIKVPPELLKDFSFIMSRIQLPVTKVTNKKIANTPLTILYVGRSSYEKRPYIVSALAKKMKEAEYPVEFKFVGDVKSSIPIPEQPFCVFLGEINDEIILGEIYEQAHILIIPSSTESGPLVFMEAMARGVVIISTPVGYIPYHIKNGISGYITSTLDEKKILIEIYNYIVLILDHIELYKKMSDHNIQYAYDNFDLKEFNEEYKSLIKSV